MSTTNPNEQRSILKQIMDFLKDLIPQIIDFLSDLIDLREGVDKEGTIVQINTNKRMNGANAWTLMCSIMIASLGLDLNSSAVIIGAMLISPLMSPILGVGLGVAINDRETFLISLQHWGVAIAIALITSYLYFLITPLGEATDQILSRTKPTLLDGLIAIFGGLAGSISVTRKDQSNAVPGVAIATALMPPLCVAGYGLATATFSIFLNAFYLFFLNSFFVALTAYLVFKLLKFPVKSYGNQTESRNAKWAIIGFSILLIVPSIVILRDVWSENRSKTAAKEFVQNYFGENSNPSAVDYNLVDRDSLHILYVKLIGRTLPPDTLPRYQELLSRFHDLDDAKLVLIQDSDLEMSYIKKVESDLQGVRAIADQLAVAERAKTVQELQIEQLEKELIALRSDTIPFSSVTQELKVLFPDLQDIAYADAQWAYNDSQLDRRATIIVRWDSKKSNKSKAVDTEKIRKFIETRCKKQDVLIVEHK